VSVIRITYTGTDPHRLVLSSTRINLLSSSAKASLVRAMNGAAKEDTNDQLIQDMAENLLEWFRRSGRTVKPEPKQQEGARWLLYPLWPATQGTLVAGASNSFKSWIGVAAAVQTCTGSEVLRGNTRSPGTAPILYVDWESDEATFGERLFAVLQGAGLPTDPCVAYRQMTVPLSDAAEALAEEIARNQYGGVILDSLSAAVGGSLVDDELANGFWNAVSYLGVPALVLAHKSADAIAKGTKRAFGSVMHENRPRMVWDATRDPEGSTVKWTVFNDNNTGMKDYQVAWNVDLATEGTDETRRLVSCEFEAVNPHDVREPTQAGDSLKDRIAYELVGGPLTSGELATFTGISAGSVRKQLSRHTGLFEKHTDGIRWTLQGARK